MDARRGARYFVIKHCGTGHEMDGPRGTTAAITTRVRTAFLVGVGGMVGLQDRRIVFGHQHASFAQQRA